MQVNGKQINFWNFFYFFTERTNIPICENVCCIVCVSCSVFFFCLRIQYFLFEKKITWKFMGIKKLVYSHSCDFHSRIILFNAVEMCCVPHIIQFNLIFLFVHVCTVSVHVKKGCIMRLNRYAIFLFNFRNILFR